MAGIASQCIESAGGRVGNGTGRPSGATERDIHRNLHQPGLLAGYCADAAKVCAAKVQEGDLHYRQRRVSIRRLPDDWSLGRQSRWAGRVFNELLSAYRGRSSGWDAVVAGGIYGDQATIREDRRTGGPGGCVHRLADRCDDRLSIAACLGEIGLLADVCAGGAGGDGLSEYASGRYRGRSDGKATGVDAALR